MVPTFLLRQIAVVMLDNILSNRIISESVASSSMVAPIEAVISAA